MMSRRSSRLAEKNKRSQFKLQTPKQTNDEDDDGLEEFVLVDKPDGISSSGEENLLESNNLDSENELRKHKGRFAVLLFFLYFLQGMPLGLTGAVPFLMSSKKVSYSDQGNFSFAFWPFSIKLLW